MQTTVFLLRVESRRRTAERIFTTTDSLTPCLTRAVEAMAWRHGYHPDSLVEQRRSVKGVLMSGETRCGDDRVVWSRVVSQPRAA